MAVYYLKGLLLLNNKEPCKNDFLKILNKKVQEMQNITETGLSTISNKIVETVLSNRVKKKSTPPPPPYLHSKLGVC